LIEEILRIKELIGTKLLNEQWSELTKIVLQGTEALSDLAKKYSDDFVKLAAATTDDEAITILAKLANAERQFADVILPQVMKTVSDEVSQEIGKIIAFGQDQLKKGVPKSSVDALIEKRLKAIDTPFEGVRTMLKKQIDDALDGYVPPTPKPPTPDVGTEAQELKKVFEDWDNLAPGKLSVKDKLLLNDLWFRGLRAKINYMLNNLLNRNPKKYQKSFEKIVSLIKEASKNTEDFTVKQELYKTIDAEIEALRKNEDFVKEEVFKVIQQELTKKIGSTKAYDFMTQLRKNDALSPDAKSYWQYLINETYLGKMLPSLSKTGKKMEGVKNIFHRAVMTATTGNPRKVGEVFEDFIRKYGTVKGLAIWYGMLWVVHRTIWPLFLSEIDTFFYYALSEDPTLKFDSWWKANAYFFKERFYDMFAPVVEELNKETGKMEPGKDRKFSLIQTAKAFTWMWDDISKGLDWHVAGGSRRLFDRLAKDVQNIAPPEIPNPLSGTSVTDIFGAYSDKIESFVDFCIAANYPIEEAEKATQDPITKYYITPDKKYQYKFVDGNFQKVTN